uniref:Membrane-associated tyrosine- and threonine-specific cdc2-inhibitory kinase wee-1.3 n=1 Tax=Caenorhabditis japonica TaxID=281687 RepID=A0A8R1I196_CAEJA
MNDGNSSTDSLEVGTSTSPPPVLATPRIVNIHNIMRETPLSTKRERMKMTPKFRRPAPKVIKTAPPVRSFYSAVRDTKPRIITPQGIYHLESPKYNPQKKDTYFEQVFSIDEIVGRGSYGEVFAVRCIEDNREYAVKVSINLLRQNNAQKYREVENHMLAGNHPNIVAIQKAWEEAGRLYIQTELCEMSLFNYCTKRHALPEPEVWNFFIDVLSAVHHLHEKDMIHDDIKPENIFVTKDLICKLGDFGLCVNLNNANDVKTAEEGDSKYLAPEVLNGRPSKASDVFSIGMTILEAATDMDLPSQGESWHQIRSGDIPERFFIGISDDLRHLITWMLQEQPQNRPTTQQLMEYPAISSRLFRRHAFIKRCQVRYHLANVLFVFITWCMAFFAVIFHHPMRMFQEISDRRSAIAAQMSNAQAAGIPAQQHTPIQTPEGSKAFAESLITITPFDYSDDENPGHLHHRRLFPVVGPVARLNFDDDDEEQATSSSNSSAIDESSSSPVRGIRHEWASRHGTPKSARKIFNGLSASKASATSSGATGDIAHGGSGDHGETEEEWRRNKYQRMMANERTLDSDDNENTVNESIPLTMSCPPAIRNRRLLRMPKLNFGLLDKKEDVEEDDVNDDAEKNSKKILNARRNINNRTRQSPRLVAARTRMMSLRGSSGDEI